jgi:hypothetical protein
MRTPRSISPSAFAKFEKDPEAYYLAYLAEPKPQREKQSDPASVGSAFDAFVKSRLMNNIFGDNCFAQLFETQVEPHVRDFAFKAGKHTMDSYVSCGAYADLLDMLEDAREEPQFEFDADTEIDGIPLFGKPDCRFVHRGGAHVILDWKVNGYCSKASVSPNKGFALVRDGLGWEKPSRNNGKSHALYEPQEFMGLTVSKFYMEQVSIDWADQLTMYGWMMGEPIGSEEVVVCIDQIVAKAAGPLGLEDGPPKLRIANHCNRVSAAHQHTLVARLKSMWEAAHTGHVFTNLDRETNDEQCRKLDGRARWMVPDDSRDGDFFARCASGGSSFYKAR